MEKKGTTSTGTGKGKECKEKWENGGENLFKNGNFLSGVADPVRIQINLTDRNSLYMDPDPTLSFSRKNHQKIKLKIKIKKLKKFTNNGKRRHTLCY